jgi:hypothetical protein
MTEDDASHRAPAWWDIYGKVQRRRSKRQAAVGRIECALRCVGEGAPGGLSGRWTHVLAEVDANRIVFRAFLPPGIRVPNPFKAPVDLRIVKATIEEQSIVASIWSLAPGCVGVTLLTPDGVVEAAVPHGRAKWMVDRIQSDA